MVIIKDGKNVIMPGLLTGVVGEGILSFRHPVESLLVLIDGFVAIIRGEDKSKLVEGGIAAYKARALDGIWATAPYLHNGAVPNLYELLLPPDRRSKTFYVGARTFDPKHVGYITAKQNEHDTLIDTTVHGNSNLGHIYGIDQLTENDRWALVEYQKTL